MLRFLPLFIFLLLAGCEKKPIEQPIRPVKAIQVKASSISDHEISFPGTLRAYQRADLSLRVDGIIVRREITVGQLAKKGELLVQLDPREYEIAVKKAEGKVDSIKAQLDFAGRDYERMQTIRNKDPGAISESLLDRKKESMNQYRGELTIAEADLEKAQDDLSYTSLEAPFDGIIVSIYVEKHEQVRAKQPILRFLDTSEREMEIHVPEKYINQLIENKVQLNFEVHLDAFPGQLFSASIKEIGTEASSSTLTYPVTLSIQQLPIELSLLPGMSGQAILQVPKMESTQALTIPKSAIFTDNLNVTYVWVVDPQLQTVHKKAIQLENDSGSCVTVREGIHSGDWIVIAGTSFLSEGQKVKLDQGQETCGSYTHSTSRVGFRVAENQLLRWNEYH